LGWGQSGDLGITEDVGLGASEDCLAGGACLGNFFWIENNLFFDMDTAILLGMIVNELISNSLKHAFPGRDKGEIQIKFRREKIGECINHREESKIENNNSKSFILIVSDDGVGVPENLEIGDIESLGFQLITSLVDQLDGDLELKMNNGTEFTMRFTV